MLKMEYLSSYTTPAMHEDIINTVIQSSRFDFLQEDTSEDVLHKLRTIWERKLLENDVIPLEPPVFHSARARRSLRVHRTLKRNSAGSEKRVWFNKKNITTLLQPLSHINRCKHIQVPVPVCNRSMPLLTSDEEETIPSFKNDMVKTIPKVKEEEISEKNINITPIKQPELDLPLVCKDVNKTLPVKVCQYTNETDDIKPKNNGVQKRERRRIQRYVPVIEPRKRGRATLFNNTFQKMDDIKQTELATISTTKPEKGERSGHLKNILKLNDVKETEQATVSVIKAGEKGRPSPLKNVLKIKDVMRTVPATVSMTKPKKEQPRRLKNILKLNDVKETEQATVPVTKRGQRGRPRLFQNVLKINDVKQTVPATVSMTKPRKRGRPRLLKDMSKVNDIKQTVTKPRQRGRTKLLKNVLKMNDIKQTESASVSTTKSRKRGPPRSLKNILKPDDVKQNQPVTKTAIRKYVKNAAHEGSITLMQIDGTSNSPKFNIKPKFKGIPVKTNLERLEEAELNTDDDITDNEDPSKVFECSNTVICQYEKVKKGKNKWNIHLKCGIMHLKGKDYVFNSASCKVKW